MTVTRICSMPHTSAAKGDAYAKVTTPSNASEALAQEPTRYGKRAWPCDRLGASLAARPRSPASAVGFTRRLGCMTDLPASSAADEPSRRARRATGALFFVPFGAAWLALGVTRLFAAPLFAYIAIAAVCLPLWWRVLRVRSAALLQAGPPPEPTAGDRRRDRWFHVVNAAQWVLILLVGNVLANVGLGPWVVPAAMLIIGAHFFPLARLFGTRAHWVTGAALVLLACVYPNVAPGGPASGVGPLLAGLVLWASALDAIRPVATASQVRHRDDAA